MIHLLIYIIRRILYAACLVLLHDSPGVGIGVLMLSSLAMLAVLIKANQWWDWEIRA